jgi:hypothetical protein
LITSSFNNSGHLNRDWPVFYLLLIRVFLAVSFQEKGDTGLKKIAPQILSKPYFGKKKIFFPLKCIAVKGFKRHASVSVKFILKKIWWY